jgi:rRNA-processing protein FCF1
MRILLDECVPNPLKREFADLDLKTVREMGWSGTKNGALLQLMSESGFTILLTSDRNIKYEQNLQQAGIAVIVMVARKNRLQDLLPLVLKVRQALTTIAPGEVIEVDNY